MRALAGPAMLLVMVGGFLVFRLASKEEAPSRDFTALEFAGADSGHTGSCYSLETILLVNREGNPSRTWTSPRDDAWTLGLDDVVQGHGGPIRIFQKFTFEEIDGLVRLTAVEASKGNRTDVELTIEQFVTVAKAQRSTPVDRCLEPGATGYLFEPRR
jgi:hypothetical protein